MNKILIIFFITFTTFTLIHEIKSEDNSTALVENLPNNNSTDDIRRGKQDLGDIISGVVASVAGSITKGVVDSVLGNTIISTREFCTFGSRRSDRRCDIYCDEYFRGPVRGYCQTALSLCVCECDSYECDRYCRRYWDDYRYDDRYGHRYPYARQRIRGRGYCTQSGCRCD